MGLLEIYFRIITTRNCPLYETGNRFKLSGLGFSSLDKKPICLFLARSISEIAMASLDEEKKDNNAKMQGGEYNCPGCSGLIKFSAEGDKGYQTPHMQLLATAERRKQMQQLGSILNLLTSFSFFQALEEDSLKEIISSTEMRKYMAGQTILLRGQAGASMFIILAGKVALINAKDEIFSYLGMGEIFGEMSLLSGNPVSVTVKAVDQVKVLAINRNDLQQILIKYPFLQMAFTRLLAQRLAASSLASSSSEVGIGGRLTEISSAELFQMFHENMKSGKIDLKLPNGRGRVFFKDGEVVLAQYHILQGINAFYDILKEIDGTFTFSAITTAETKELKPIGPFMKILMDGLRQIDEAADGSDQ